MSGWASYGKKSVSHASPLSLLQFLPPGFCLISCADVSMKECDVEETKLGQRIHFPIGKSTKDRLVTHTIIVCFGGNQKWLATHIHVFAQFTGRKITIIFMSKYRMKTYLEGLNTGPLRVTAHSILWHALPWNYCADIKPLCIHKHFTSQWSDYDCSKQNWKYLLITPHWWRSRDIWNMSGSLCPQYWNDHCLKFMS